ncbi:MAG: hypothetical protein DCC88_00405 [Spirobacillus cienkowskii]|jgi:SPP1 gp7 family putative phage head morphogenesis protein|uniref:Phage head morphogenesis domain-containing protein n=1 Tax=Spirobacillus cienkowskii TaxID=495820 RepID=A0A369KUY1_9BACT|nr:MAG: hypothetical protein DCC88_00405 [Spirobacillus cienkowskii]
MNFIEYAKKNSKPNYNARIQAFPAIALERQFQRELVSLTNPFVKYLKKNIEIKTNDWIKTYSLNLDSDESDDKSDIENFFEKVITALEIYLPYKVLKEFFSKYSNKIYGFSKNKLTEQVEKIFKIKPHLDKDNYQKQLNLWVEKNIFSFKEALYKYVNNNKMAIYNILEKISDKDSIESEIKINDQKLRNSIAFIARDQVSGLEGSVTKSLQTEVGFDEFVWITCRDERVRAAHRELDGKLCSWNKLPIINGNYIFPGSEINCRCVARPIITNK